MPRAGHGSFPCQGLWWTPSSGKAPATALIASHYNIDFAEHYLAEPLAERGFGFLGWNTRFRGAEAYFTLDHALAEIGVGVRWLHRAAGVDTVKELKGRNAANLAAKVAEVNGQRKLTRDTPDEAKIAGWIGQAKTLPAMIGH